MDRNPTRNPRPKLDQQNNFMSTKEERQAVLDFADRKDWSTSKALRYLVMKGLATEEGE